MTHTKKDWLPFNHADLRQKAIVTMAYLDMEGVRERFGLGAGTPQGAWIDQQFTPAFAELDVAYEKWKDPAERNRVQMQGLRSAEAVFKPLFRQLYIGFLKYNPLVSNEDLAGMGLPSLHQGHRTPVHVPETLPASRVLLPSPYVVEIHFYDEHSHHAKPAGVHGVELAWAMLDAPPKEMEDLANVRFSTRSPIKLNFDEYERGKKIFFALRWQNTRGENGPWSRIYNSIVP
jgi:hypothetical protein